MDQQNNNIQKYKSCSTGNPCTAAQYIAELVCIRKREKENVGNLEYKFWNKSHKDEYQVQIRVANKLINKYSEEAVLHYLNSKLGARTYSLGFLHSSKKFVLVSKFVEKGVADSFKELQEQKKKTKKIIDVNGVTQKSYTAKTSKNQNTLLNKLRNAENGKR